MAVRGVVVEALIWLCVVLSWTVLVAGIALERPGATDQEAAPVLRWAGFHLVIVSMLVGLPTAWRTMLVKEAEQDRLEEAA